MKKTILVMTALLSVIASSLCFASDSSDLAKQQRSVTRVIDAFDGDPIPDYAALTSLFSDNLNKALGEKGYASLRTAINEKFGTLKEANFYSYQRFNEADRLTYFGAFSKEKIVVMVFSFDKTGKLLDFAFSPYQAPAKNEEKKDAK